MISWIDDMVDEDKVELEEIEVATLITVGVGDITSWGVEWMTDDSWQYGLIKVEKVIKGWIWIGTMILRWFIEWMTSMNLMLGIWWNNG